MHHMNHRLQQDKAPAKKLCTQALWKSPHGPNGPSISVQTSDAIMVQVHSRGMLLLNIKFQATCTSDIPNSLVKRMFDDSMTLHRAIRDSPCVTIYLPIYLSTYLPIYLSTYLPIYLPIYLSIYLSIHLPT